MQPRYSSLNQAIHWITALGMVAMLPLAWTMTALPDHDPHAGVLFTAHKTIGMLILALTVFRLAWRWIDRPPALPARVAAWDRWVAYATYVLLYAVLLVMPISGYAMGAGGEHPLKLFGVVPVPMILPHSKAIGELADNVHAYTQWAVYALIVLHLLGVAFHLIWGRDGVLGRMLPPFATEPAE